MTGKTPPDSEEYTFEAIADGVVFAHARSGSSALSNSGIVDLGGSSLVVDTSLTLKAARELRTAAAATLGRPPALAFNTHWHLDHLFGNQLFADGPIFATERTIELFAEKREELRAEIAPAALAADLKKFEAELLAATHPAARTAYAEVVAINRALLAEATALRLTAPTDGFDREFVLPGTRGARLISFGAGHTESDGLLYLPRERVVFAGDLVVNHRHPNLTSGDPEHWLVVLDEIDGLRPTQIVPGHGAIADVETVQEIREYLHALIAVSHQRGSPKIPSRYRDWVDPGQFERNMEFLRERRARNSRSG
jgi:cyclase